ncbi:MFS transporter [Micromonospora echinaurantiaca]|nr:MFS transporter [Micromonospora echinaurantiaca]
MSFVERVLLLNAFVLSFGFGLYATTSVIYLTRFSHISAQQIGLALSVSGILWMLVAGSAGRTVDRVGARETAIGAGLLSAAVVPLMIFAQGFPACCAVLCALAITQKVSSVGHSALVGHLLDQDRRVKVAARNHSMSNAGLAVGSAAAGVALVVGTRSAFVVILVVFSASLAAVNLMTRRLPKVTPGVVRRTNASRVSRRRGFLFLSVVIGLISIHETILVIGMPLWLLHHTRAPAPLAAWLTIANMACVVLFQVHVAQRTDSVPNARRAVAQGAIAVAAACVVIALASLPRSATIATSILLLGVLTLTYGEMRVAAGGWGLRYGIAPRAEHGLYGAIFSMGKTAETAVGPAVVTFMTGSFTILGWGILAAGFVGLAFLIRPGAAWAVKEQTVRLAASVEPGPTPTGVVVRT